MLDHVLAEESPGGGGNDRSGSERRNTWVLIIGEMIEGGEECLVATDPLTS